jgi:hypothetical protein
VITSSKKARALFACIHHGAETRNWRGLEEYIERDAEGNILSRRKREDTAANAKGCTWEMYWSVRSVGSIRSIKRRLRSTSRPLVSLSDTV